MKLSGKIHFCLWKYRFLLLVILILAGCKEEKDPTVLLVTPEDLYLIAEPGEIVTFQITCRSDVELAELTINSKEVESFSRTEVDTLFSGKSFNLKFEYQVPMVYQNTTIFLEFVLKTAGGDIIRSGRIIEVSMQVEYLKETAGHVMFSKASGKQNAYNLYEGKPLYSHLADSSEMHIMDTTDAAILLNRWVSPAGVSFVRFNDFDYANCTNKSVREAFSSGIKREFIYDLQSDDILIIRLFENEADSNYVAVKITAITDNEGSESDKYVFNIKK